MKYFDLAILETGDGGDIQLVANDLGLIYGIENQAYLAMFGGNKKASTKNQSSNLAVSAQNFDWWGNSILMPNDPNVQMNSLTENILNTTPLTSAGRLVIENAIKQDLQFLAPSAKITVTVIIVATDKINVSIQMIQAENKEVIIINFKKAQSGDWFLLDFNNDFYL